MRAATGVLVITGVAALVLPASSVAATGGARARGSTRVSAVRCVPSDTHPCAAQDVLSPGGEVRVRGRALDASRTLVFRGRRSRRDDTAAPVRYVGAGHFEAVVPSQARSGRVEVVTTFGARARSPRPVRVALLASAPQPGALSGNSYFAGEARQPTFTVTRSHPGTVERIRTTSAQPL